MSHSSILPAFEDSQAPAAVLPEDLAIVEGQGRHDPASHAVTRFLLLRLAPWSVLLLSVVASVATLRH
ncbi:hypothetical protein [Ramlibacter sp. AN1133]|uniref:hypothetical protein n=1 Tax=Ramlibacter sp. AN1133 TaxID=3133429 RepID=UPI0030C090FB